MSAMKDDDPLCVPAATISAADSDIAQYCEITSKKQPIMYDLSTVNEYRTNETNVPADTFLIVDTTGATYSKITEDARKGKQRELIGIVPLVTTAANALYAQSMIQVNDYDAWKLESISGDVLVTLSGNDISAGGKPIRGLLSSDMVKRINTHGFYRPQTNSFTAQTIYTMLSSVDKEEITLGDSLYEWRAELKDFVSKSSVLTADYDFGTLNGMKDFYADVSALCETSEDTEVAKESDVASLPALSAITTASELKKALEDALRSYIEKTSKSIVWVYESENDDGGTSLCVIGDSAKVSAMIDVYNDTVGKGDPTWAASASYVDPATVKFTLSATDDGESEYMVATMMSATALVKPEWHGVDGDDSLPDTICLDANNYFSTIQPSIDGEGFDPEHLKDIGVVVYKMYLDAAEGNKVSYEPVEAYCGSLYKDDKDPNTGVTKFIDTIINSQSQYINFFSNCFSSKTRKSQYLKDIDILFMKPSTGASLGLYESMTQKYISVSKSIYDGMNKAFTKVSDINERDVDIVCDAGLANIASYMKAIYGDKG